MRILRTVILLLAAIGMSACAGVPKEIRQDAAPEKTAETEQTAEEDGTDTVHSAETPLPDHGRLDGFSYVIQKENEYDSTNRNRGYLCLENTGRKGRWRISSGEKSSGGYGLAVMDIRAEEGTVKVILRETEPDPDSAVTMALTYPALTLRLSPCPASVLFENEDGAEYERLRPPWEEPRRAVMADGILYLDTGYLSAPGGRCGTMDGYPRKVIEREKMPEEDGEANFETIGWQSTGDKNLIDVLIDHEFWVFAREYTAYAEGKEIPGNVLSFMAAVEEVRHDGTIVVRTDDQTEDSFILKKNTRCLLPASAYDSGIYSDTPIVGSTVIVLCSGRFREGDPVRMLDVYQVSPIGSNFIQGYYEME